MVSHSHDHKHCSGIGGVYQSLDEIDFARGPWMAAMNGDLPAIKLYLEKGGEANLTDSSGYTALHYAARNGNYNICKELIACRANVNTVTKSGKSTALHRAAFKGHATIVKLLLDNQADPTLTDDDGRTALHKAAEGRNAESSRILIKAAPQTQHVLDNKAKYPKDYVDCNADQKEAYKALWWTEAT